MKIIKWRNPESLNSLIWKYQRHNSTQLTYIKLSLTISSFCENNNLGKVI